MLNLWCAFILSFLSSLATCRLVSDVHMRVVRQHGQTALMLAAQNGHTDTVRLLLERGADVDQIDGVSAACTCI